MDSIGSSMNNNSAVPTGEEMSTSSSRSSSISPEDAVKATAEEKENSPIVSNVKERAKHLNKMQSETDLNDTRVEMRRKERDKGSVAGDGDDDSHVPVSLNATEREWMVLASSADYQPMAKLLHTNNYLAKRKDFTSGYTALHWAAKHGKAEVVKLIAGSKGGVNVNARSFGGYTALHLAAQHNHESIIALLVQTYHADPNIRDYSGKKAKQYLKSSATARAQLYLFLGVNVCPELLQARRISSIGNVGVDDYFRRGSNSRVSSKALAVSSAIQTSRGALKSPGYRTWGSSENVSRTPTASPRQSPRGSPMGVRKGSLNQAVPRVGSAEQIFPQEAEPSLMPPPRTKKIKKRRKTGIESGDTNTEVKRCESNPDIYQPQPDTPTIPQSRSSVFY